MIVMLASTAYLYIYIFGGILIPVNITPKETTDFNARTLIM